MNVLEPVAAAETGSQALVVIKPQMARPQRYPAHRPANFIAHLIASRDGHPQTRDKRRAEPFEAMKAYRMAMAGPDS